jgi:hypothetical protein
MSAFIACFPTCEMLWRSLDPRPSSGSELARTAYSSATGNTYNLVLSCDKLARSTVDALRRSAQNLREPADRREAVSFLKVVRAA